MTIMRKKGSSSSKEAVTGVSEHLVRVVERQGAECFEQGKAILKTLRNIDESVDIIAREIARYAKKVGLTSSR